VTTVVAVDQERLRHERRARCFNEMERQGIDVLLLGREPNARYVSGANRLWLAGTRAFAPSCVVVRATRGVHLLSTSDAGVPADIPATNLFPVTWNPLNLMEAVKAAPGVAEAAVVGVDGLTPLFAQLLPLAAPKADVVDADELMRSVRRVKTSDEVACIMSAIGIAEAALTTSTERLQPGVSERALLGAFERKMTEFGVTAPAREGTFCVTPRAVDRGQPRLRQLVSDTTASEGDLVAFASGVLYQGYEGTIARTRNCGAAAPGASGLVERFNAARDGMVSACRAGITAAEIRGAYDATGEPPSPVPLVHGVGIGFEGPVLSGEPAHDDEDWVLEAGMVLAVQAYVWEPGLGGYLGQDVVRVTADAPEVLTTIPHALS
jgi:Xaa-Pro dipeptidase